MSAAVERVGAAVGAAVDRLEAAAAPGKHTERKSVHEASCQVLHTFAARSYTLLLFTVAQSLIAQHAEQARLQMVSVCLSVGLPLCCLFDCWSVCLIACPSACLPTQTDTAVDLSHCAVFCCNSMFPEEQHDQGCNIWCVTGI